MDSRASTPFYMMLGMEVSLPVRAPGLLCFLVGTGVGVALAVAGSDLLNGRSIIARLTFLKVISDDVLPFVEPTS
jgi:hypothetical protein